MSHRAQHSPSSAGRGAEIDTPAQRHHMDAMAADKPRIVIARKPTRSRPEKPRPVAFAGPRIVVAKKSGMRSYLTRQEAAAGPEADPEVKAFFDRMLRSPDHHR